MKVAGTTSSVRVGLQPVVQHDDVEAEQELALVLVHALDLRLEHRFGIDGEAEFALDVVGQRYLVGALDLADLRSRNAASLANVSRPRSWSRSVIQPSPILLADQRRQPGIGLEQPAPRRDAVGLVVEALRDRTRRSRASALPWSRRECNSATPLSRASRRWRGAPCAPTFSGSSWMMLIRRRRSKSPG